ncbi:hypothetical protein NUM3379_12380 [Kineococcus sp. NUM-3379]
MPQPTPAANLLSWLRRRVLLADAVLAAALALVVVPVSGAQAESSAGWLTGTALVVPLVLRRLAPVASAALVALAALGSLVVAVEPLLAAAVVPVSVYSLARHAPRRAALAGLAAALAGALLLALRYAADNLSVAVLLAIACAASAAAAHGLGSLLRARAGGGRVPEGTGREGTGREGTGQEGTGQGEDDLDAGGPRRPADVAPPDVPLVDLVSALARRHPLAVDAAAVVPLVVLTALTDGSARLLHLAFALALTVPLVWRRVAPVTSAAVVAGVAVAQVALLEYFLVADVAVLVSVYALAAYAPRWARSGGLALAFAGAAVAGARWFSGTLTQFVAATVFMVVLAVAAYALGVVRRVRLQHVDQLAERARLLEVERENEARLAATSERQRIAREMHDVVAHSLSVIIAQADGGRYAGRADPAAAVDALETIASTGRQALTDMRSLLGVLRQEPGSERLPQPDTTQIPELVESVRRSGLPVDLEVEGTARELPPGPGLAAYRIVQESLTNVLKHAGPACRAAVFVRWEEHCLRLAVLDDGRGAAATAEGKGSGQGLTGMRERAQLHGGRVLAGPRQGGGFEVHAELPYPRAS